MSGNADPETKAGDSPGQGLVVNQTPNLTLKNLVVNDSFTTWLMFKPLGNESCWVPLKKFDWLWSATAHRVNGYGIMLDSSTAPGNKTGSDTNIFPQWSSTIVPGAPWVLVSP